MLKFALSWSFVFLIAGLPNHSEAFFSSWWGDPVKPDTFKSQPHERLYDYYVMYKELAESGGWETLKAKGDQKLENQSSEFHVKLARRLYLTKDLKKKELPKETKLKVIVLKAGLKSFQERHSLDTNGILNEQTLAELNVPAEFRVAQIKTAMKSWKDLPDDLGKTHILVNIPAFKLGVFEKGKEMLDMKVIVGKEYKHETPVFSEDLDLIIFRPYWNIPRSIVEADILPKAIADPNYLESFRYELVKDFNPDTKPVELTVESMKLLVDGKINLRQRSGPGNALGLVKFIFPNKYAVYMHDTPADRLFDREERDFSHGCVRVEKPKELAAFLMGRESKAYTADKIEELIQSEDRFAYGMKTPVPVHLVYQTVQVGDGEKLYFHKDIYDRIKLTVADK